MSLWDRITVPCFHLILYWFHNSYWYSIFGFDHFLTLKICFQRTFHKIYFRDHLPHGHLKSGIYKSVTLWFVRLHDDRYGFAFMYGEFNCPSTTQIRGPIRPFCNLSLSFPVLILVINFVPFGDFFPHFLFFKQII